MVWEVDLDGEVAEDLARQGLEGGTAELVGAAVPVTQDELATQGGEGSGKDGSAYHPTSIRELNSEVMAGAAVDTTARSRKKRK
jgi:hypothetical protein